MMRTIVGVAALALAAGASAQGYPSRPVTLVVGFAPGGGTDITARTIAKKLSDLLKQNVVVENRAGAGGNIATDYVAKSNPDGYTILLGNVGSLAVAPHLIKNLPYDPLRDLAPITMGVVFANVLVVHPSVKARTLADYVKEANSRPGGMPYGTSGIGGAGHLAGELFKLRAKANLVHVPYKGGGPAMSDLLGGQVPSVFASAPSAVGPVKSGKIFALAVTSAKRSPSFPDVPTVAEQGYPGYEATNWYAFVAPVKTPKAVIDRLHRDLVASLKDKTTHDQLMGHGEEPSPTTPKELADYMKREFDTWGKVVKAAGIEAQ